MFKESHLTIHKTSVSFFLYLTIFFSPVFAIIQCSQGRVEYLFYTIKIVLTEIS